jgi:ABC-type nitrate/sulfonate/bicarbonate transport system substrate-binding protein
VPSVLTLASQSGDSQEARIPAVPAIRREVISLGYLRLLDSAPLLVAEAAGLFAKRGVKVELIRQVGWATIREKLAHGELAMAAALGPMAFSLQLGIRTPPRDMIVGMVLNLEGNGITLSEELRGRNVLSAKDFAREVRGTRTFRRYKLGVVSTDSSHNLIPRRWLRSGGLNPDKDVRTVSLPPEQMTNALASGHLDGFCVGEPWNSEAWRSRIGFPVASSASLHPGHPEKVLLTRKEFVDAREEEFLAVIAALVEACEFCDRPESRKELIELLSHEHCLDFDPDLLDRVLSHVGEPREESAVTSTGCPMRFHSGNANSPTLKRGLWIAEMMDSEDMLGRFNGSSRSLVEKVFRWDVFARARRSLPPES